MRNQQIRNNQKEAIRNQQMTQAEKNYREAERLKAERAQHEEMIAIQKRTEELKAQSMKQMVRNQKDEAIEMRMAEQQQKRLQQRQELIRKINEENEKRMQIEREVARLEQEEAEWIRKLQNTNQIQATAFGELETALNGDPVELDAKF
jgi:hypothetical protein